MTRRETIALIIERLALAGCDFPERERLYIRVTGKGALAAMDAAELRLVLDEVPPARRAAA